MSAVFVFTLIKSTLSRGMECFIEV